MSAQIPKNENVRAVLCCAVLCMIVACCTCRGLVVRARARGGGDARGFWFFADGRFRVREPPRHALSFCFWVSLSLA